MFKLLAVTLIPVMTMFASDLPSKKYLNLTAIKTMVAAAEAKLQLGTSSVDTQMQDIEREAMDIQLQDKLLEYKQSMGMLGSGSNNAGKQISAGSGTTNEEQNAS